jgi:cytochrome c556
MRKAIAMAASTALVLLAGCGGEPPLEDTPEGRAYLERQSIMDQIAEQVQVLGGMARGDIPDDEAAFTAAATALVPLAQRMTEGFQVEGIVSASRAVPEIWQNMEDFEQKAQDTVDAAMAVANAAQSGDFEGAKELAGNIGGTCGGCHRPYRGPDPDA